MDISHAHKIYCISFLLFDDGERRRGWGRGGGRRVVSEGGVGGVRGGGWSEDGVGGVRGGGVGGWGRRGEGGSQMICQRDLGCLSYALPVRVVPPPPLPHPTPSGSTSRPRELPSHTRGAE